jgi:hypothetical protein
MGWLPAAAVTCGFSLVVVFLLEPLLSTNEFLLWLDKTRGFLESMNPIAIAGPTVESLLSRYHRLLETEAADLLMWRS